MVNHVFPTTESGGPENSIFKWLRYGVILISLALALGAAFLLTHGAAQAANPDLPKLAVDATWTIESVVDLRFFYEMTDHSLAKFEDTGADKTYLHLAYGGDHLYYAYFNGTSWSTEEVDLNPSVGSFASIAVDSENNPHIAYYDAEHGNLKYATKWFGTWWIETVDTPTPDMCLPPSLASESIDPFLSEDGLNLARPWLNPEFAEDQPSLLLAPNELDCGVGQYTSIGLDSLEVPHISYYQFDINHTDDFNRLKYANKDGGVWTTQIVQESGSAGHKREGKYTSIAFDTNDHPHIAFLDDDMDDVRLAWIGPAGRWNWKNLYDGEEKNVGGWISLVINSSNTCYISFYDKSIGALYFAELKKCHLNTSELGDLTVSQVDNSGDTGLYSSLALDGLSSTSPGVSYFNNTDDDLKYGKGNPPTNLTKIGHDYSAGMYTSLVYDIDNDPHITFLNMGLGLLQEAYRPSSTWLFRTIDTNHDVGIAASLDLDAGDTPYISYLDDSINELMIAKRNRPSGDWTTKPITGTNEIGSYSAIKIDTEGNGHVAFYDIEEGDLEYAFGKLNRTNSSVWTWSHKSIDRTGDVGQYVSMDLDVNNRPHISYYDATNQNLNYAYYTGSAWVTKTIEFSIADAGRWSSIKVDNTPQPNTKVYISFYVDEWSSTNPQYALRLAYRNLSLGPPEWRFYTVDDITDTYVGMYNSLDLTATLEPRIAYTAKYDPGGTYYLKYAKGNWTGSTWNFTTEVVEAEDENFDIGYYASLALGTPGDPNADVPQYKLLKISKNLTDWW